MFKRSISIPVLRLYRSVLHISYFQILTKCQRHIVPDSFFLLEKYHGGSHNFTNILQTPRLIELILSKVILVYRRHKLLKGHTRTLYFPDLSWTLITGLAIFLCYCINQKEFLYITVLVIFTRITHPLHHFSCLVWLRKQ